MAHWCLWCTGGASGDDLQRGVHLSTSGRRQHKRILAMARRLLHFGSARLAMVRSLSYVAERWRACDLWTFRSEPAQAVCQENACCIQQAQLTGGQLQPTRNAGAVAAGAWCACLG